MYDICDVLDITGVENTHFTVSLYILTMKPSDFILCSHNTQSHRLQQTHYKQYSFSHTHQIRLNKCNNLNINSLTCLYTVDPAALPRRRGAQIPHA